MPEGDGKTESVISRSTQVAGQVFLARSSRRGATRVSSRGRSRPSNSPRSHSGDCIDYTVLIHTTSCAAVEGEELVHAIFRDRDTDGEGKEREREAEQERRSERLPLVTHSQCQSVSALSLCLSAAGVYDYWHTTTTKTEEFQSGRWRGSCVEHAARAGDPRAAQEPHLLTHFASDQ